MFRNIKSPEAEQLAALAESDPRALFLMGEQVGGLKNLYAMAQEGAARQRYAQASAGAPAGSREQLLSQAAAAAETGEIGVSAQFQQLAQNLSDAGVETTLADVGVGNGQVRKALINKATGEIVSYVGEPKAQFRPQTQRAVYGANGELLYSEGSPPSASQVNRASQLANRSQALDNAISLYPVVRDNPALHARSDIAQPAARAASVVSPEAGGQLREAMTGGATPEQQALYNLTVQQAQGVAARLLNGGGAQLSEGDARRAALMLSGSSDPETFRMAVKAQIVSSIRAANYEARNTGEIPDYDIRKTADLIRLRNVLKAKGFTKGEAEEILREVIEPMPGWKP
jgi:hypothetical protein